MAHTFWSGADTDTSQVKELLLQSLEHEMGGVMVYEAALQAARNENLKQKWHQYLEQTRRHVRILQDVAQTMGVDPATRSPGRQIVAELAKSLIVAIEIARKGNPVAAELIACECVVLAETKDHLDWELLGEVAKSLSSEKANVLRVAYEEVEDEEDEHLYYTRGWCRELWLQSLGLKAVLPPPEERARATDAMAAARAERQRQA